MGQTSSCERNKENPKVVKPQENIQSSQSLVVTQKSTPDNIPNECCSECCVGIRDQVKLTSDEVQSFSQEENITYTLPKNDVSPCNTSELNTPKEKKDYDVKTDPQCINSDNLLIKGIHCICYMVYTMFECTKSSFFKDFF